MKTMQHGWMLSDFVYASNATRRPDASFLVLPFSGKSNVFVAIDFSNKGYSLMERYLYTVSQVYVKTEPLLGSFSIICQASNVLVEIRRL